MYGNDGNFLKVIIKRAPTMEEKYFLFVANDDYIGETSYHTNYEEITVTSVEFKSIIRTINLPGLRNI